MNDRFNQPEVLKPVKKRKKKEKVPPAIPIEVVVLPREVGDDPAITIYGIIVESLTGAWPETFGTRETATAFLQGLKVMATMLGHSDILIPTIPDRS